MSLVSHNNNRRVVITGLGVVSSLGIGWQPFWKSLLGGKSGISLVAAFDTAQYDRHYAGEIKDFDMSSFMGARRAARVGRASQLMMSASLLAIGDARMPRERIKRMRCGICAGTTMGEPQVMEKLDERCFPRGALAVDFASAMAYPPSSLATTTAHMLGLTGPNIVFGNACAAGNYAIGHSFDAIRLGMADMMLAGGSDALSRIAFTGFGRLFAMAPEKCQPFDKNRAGMLLGEGAGVLVLEELESARQRKARIYAEVAGYGLSCDARHMTAPDVNGIATAIKRSLASADMSPGDVSYISAHGTGTKENDTAECRALEKVFGRRAGEIPVSSIKSMLGHTMGAASALEAIACCLAIETGKIPPTINLKEQDPECDIDCVPNKARKHKVHVALNNSQAFGGNNACVVLKEVFK